MIIESRSSVHTSQNILTALGDINEYHPVANQEVIDKKRELVSRLERISEDINELLGRTGIINEKEQVIEELNEILKETIELFKLRNEDRVL